MLSHRLFDPVTINHISPTRIISPEPPHLQAEDGGRVASHHHAQGPGLRQDDQGCPGARLEVFRHETILQHVLREQFDGGKVQ